MAYDTAYVKGLDKAIKRMEKYRGKPLHDRMDKAVLEGARLAVPAIRAAAPRGATGNLRRSVRARKGRLAPHSAVVGPVENIAFYRHMVIGGTKPHSLAGQGRHSKWSHFAQPSPTGKGTAILGRNIRHPGSPPNPFVNRGADPMRARITVAVRHFILDTAA